MSNMLVFTAAILLLLTGVAHSILGEMRLITPLLTLHQGILGNRLARFLLRFVWHSMSVCFALLSLILVVLVYDPAMVRFWAVVGTGVAFIGMGLCDMIGSRGRHIGWPLLVGIGAAALASLAR